MKGITVKKILEIAGGSECAEKHLREVGLEPAEYLERDLGGELSGGERKRIEIASVLAKNADLMIFDEPEAGIDLWSFEDLRRVFKRLNKAKKTGYKYQVVDNDLNEEEAKRIRKLIEKYSLTSQIQLNASSKRYYPLSALSSHTLGFVNADGIGIYGLEKVYNNILEGTSGKYITAQDAHGGDMPFQYETYIESENGYNLVTTIVTYTPFG